MNSSIDTKVIDDLIRQMSETLNDIDGYYESLVSAVRKKPATDRALWAALHKMTTLVEDFRAEFSLWMD